MLARLTFAIVAVCFALTESAALACGGGPSAAELRAASESMGRAGFGIGKVDRRYFAGETYNVQAVVDLPFAYTLVFPRLTVAEIDELARLERLQQIAVRGPLGVDEFNAFKRMPHLLGLDVTSAEFADDDLRALAGATSLTMLELKFTDARLVILRDAGLLHLMGCAHKSRDESTRAKSDDEIGSLDLAYHEVSAAAVKEFVHLPRMRWLRLAGAALNDETARQLTTLSSLAELDIRGADPGEAALDALTSIKTLKRLDLHLNDAQFAFLLERDRLHLWSQVGNGDFEPLEHDEPFTSLNLTDCETTAATMTRLARLPQLIELSLDASQATDDAIRELLALPKLATLRVRGDLAEATLVAASKLPKLQTLDVNVDAPMMNAMAKHRLLHLLEQSRDDADGRVRSDDEITTFDITWLILNREELLALQALPKLATLPMSRHLMMDETLPALVESGLLTKVQFDRRWSAAGANDARPRSLDEIVSLELSDTRVTDEAVPLLAKLPNLKRLNLERAHFTEAGVAELQRRLPKCEIRR